MALEFITIITRIDFFPTYSLYGLLTFWMKKISILISFGWQNIFWFFSKEIHFFVLKVFWRKSFLSHHKAISKIFPFLKRDLERRLSDWSKNGFHHPIYFPFVDLREEEDWRWNHKRITSTFLFSTSSQEQ